MNIIAISCYKKPLSGWWFGTCFIFPFSWEFHHPNWRTPSFFRGAGWNHQPVIVFVIGIFVIGIIVTITTFTMNIIAISCYKNPYLVGGLEHVLYFHSVGNFIIPTDELHHFSEGQVETTNQLLFLLLVFLLLVLLLLLLLLLWIS